MNRFTHTRRWAALFTCASICAPSIGWAQYEPEEEADEAMEPEAAQDVEPEAVQAEEPAPQVKQRPRKVKAKAKRQRQRPAQYAQQAQPQVQAQPQIQAQPALDPEPQGTRVRVEPIETMPLTVAPPPAPPPAAWDIGPRTIGWVEREPNTEVIFGGIFVLSSAYLFSAMAAAGSPVKADEQLYVPLVGPWLDIAKRPDCGAAKNQPSCRTEPANVTLLVTSGVAQGIGTLVLMGGILFPKMKVVSTRVGEVEVLPQAGPGTAGLSASGRLPL